MRLSTLRNVQPGSLTHTLILALEDCGIRTEMDLLFSTTTVEIFRQIPSGTASLAEIEEFKALVVENAAAPGQTAQDILDADKLTESVVEMLSGSPRLDKFLSGLTGPRRLLEVSGDKGGGKTSLVLQLMLRHLVSQPHSSVLWIDTTSDFPLPWASEMLESMASENVDALDRLQLAQAFDVETVFRVLETVQSSNNVPTNMNIRAIVVDDLTSLISPLLSPFSPQGHAIMSGFMRQLRAMAQNLCLTIFVINNSVAIDPGQPNSIESSNVWSSPVSDENYPSQAALQLQDQRSSNRGL